MAAIWLFSSPGPSRWTTYVAVGLAVVLLGLALFWLGGGWNHPTTGQGQEPFLLSVFLLGLGAFTVLVGAVLRTWKPGPPRSEPRPPSPL
jgi:hypothetical protein